MTKKENTDNSLVEANIFDGIDVKELFETTKLGILPSYNFIPETDLNTSRKVVIMSLPEPKFIEKVNKSLLYMIISDNGIKYSLSSNSIALRRSLIALAITNSNSIEQIDLFTLIGKQVLIKRREFTNKEGYISKPLQFFEID